MNNLTAKYYTEIEEKPIWSLFKYIYKPCISGLDEVYEDARVYFTIPLGVMDSTKKVHYLTFPCGGHYNDILEFFITGGDGAEG